MITINELCVRKANRMICAISKLSVAAGERVAIRGANGSGKSTLLRVIAGLESDYAGQCSIDAAWRDRVFVQQAPLLFRGTVAFNLLYGLKARGVGRAECEQRLERWLDQLALTDLAHRRTAGLSGGEKKRVALGRALILHPRLALLDEPLADLDEEGSAAVLRAFDESPKTTIVIASPVQLPVGFTSREISIHRATTEPSVS